MTNQTSAAKRPWWWPITIPYLLLKGIRDWLRQGW